MIGEVGRAPCRLIIPAGTLLAAPADADSFAGISPGKQAGKAMSAAVALSAVDSLLPPDSIQLPIELPIARDLAAERLLERVQRELDAARSELDALQRRDSSLRFHMQRLD